MILQALKEFYENRIKDLNVSKKGVPDQYLSIEKISYAVVIDEQGSMISILDIRIKDESGNPRPQEMIVPEAVIGRAGRVKLANFLWDNSGYLLGASNKNESGVEIDKFNIFRDLHNKVLRFCPKNTRLNAVLNFLNTWEPEKGIKTLIKYFPTSKSISDLYKSNLVFKLLKDKRRFIHQDPEIYKAWKEYRTSQKPEKVGMCLIEGEYGSIARLHHLIKGVKGAQSTGAAVVSFNLNAFESYKKEQNYNAPISEKASFKYSTALNRLLMYSFGQRLQIADTTTIFWAERASPLETIFGQVLDPRLVDDEASLQVLYYLQRIRDGKQPDNIDGSIRFFILGLAPNASRIAVRFWYVNTVDEFNKNLGLHLSDMEIEKQYDNDPDFPGIWSLLIETARRYRKNDPPINGDINPILAGAMMRSILTGSQYPASLLSAIIERIRADRMINYYRAAIIKAVINRYSRIMNKRMEATMGLNKESKNTAYRLGRLFAVLEKAQEEAIPGANATIKDRFYGSASANPSIVFPQLIRLSQHHLSKIDPGSRITKEKLIQSILGDVEQFPAHLPLEEQGLFALGYYHQRNDFFKKIEMEKL